MCAAREFYYFLRRGYYEHPWGSYTNVGMRFCFLDKDFFPIVDNHKLIAKITGMEMAPVDASSTKVRNLVKAGMPITGLVPPGVEEYIIEHKLYK